MRSIQVELDHFFSDIALPNGRTANDDAFRMARKKLKPSAFIEINQTLLADQSRLAERWNGFRVVAGDSTTLYLPTTQFATTARSDDGFDCYHTDSGGRYSLARGAALCDAASGLILRADIASDAKGERSMLCEQLDALADDDLLVLDRGYPAMWLFALLWVKQRHFCIRLTLDFSNQVKDFVASGKQSQQVDFSPSAADCARHGLPQQRYSIRLIRVQLKSGATEVLATSLLDQSCYPVNSFADLYRKRWRIEEAFRHIKCRIKLEQFGGETPLAIRQEFHATILLHNLAILTTLAAKARYGAAQLHANLTHATHWLRQRMAKLLFDPYDSVTTLFAASLAKIHSQMTRRRPGREGPPRKAKRKKPRHHRAYK